MKTIQIFDHEYNEYVVGYVINTDKGSINAQFEQCRHSNHPTPAYLLYLGCSGDNTADHLADDDRDEVMDYIRNNSEMDELENAYTRAMYNGSALKEKCPPIHKWEIDAAAFEETAFV